jgi:hypothetical protein
MNDGFAKIGEPISEPPPSVFELVIEDHVPFVNPKSYGLANAGDLTSCINPADYFVTSGDAIEKTKILERDIWQLAGELRKRSYALLEKEHGCTSAEAQALFRDGIRPSRPKHFHEYEVAVWKAAGQARKLLNALSKAKGDNCFLETEWENHKLLCIPKNPRTPRN